LRAIEDRLDVDRRKLNQRAERLSAWTFAELWCALAGFVVLGLVWSRLLVRSITDPIARLQAAATGFGRHVDPGQFASLVPAGEAQTDELGRLARAYHDMAVRITAHIRELETLEGIGTDINVIGPDGLDGVLRRITDRAAELVEADACLVLLRNDKMGCWVVEAASGAWNERLYKSVMLWEEFPVSVQAYETGTVAYGNELRRDQRPEVVRRNLIGSSMIAVPLLSQGKSFGVLVLLSRHNRDPGDWNGSLAVGLAQQAAVAISNARLYEAVQRRQQGLLARLRHLEYLADTLAHDLKGPGQRMEELTDLISREYHGRLDGRMDRWLALLRENGRELVERVEGILAVARVGTGVGPVAAVDPASVLSEVLKGWAGELERRHGRVAVDPDLPRVACHAAYLRQIFDNVVSNALKYADPDRPVRIQVSAQRRERMACFSVRDNGIGIPAPHRARVFEPFVRLRQTSAEGSGIGLTIVHRIVELYGGTIWIDGDQQEGCTVHFTLPWFSEGYAAEQQLSGSESPSASTPGSEYSE
jgi:signal transduction histidine kinase